MTHKSDYYFIRQFSEDIRLCFVRIPGFIRAFIPNVDPHEFNRQRQKVIDPSGPLGFFFSTDEFERINRFKVLKKQVEWMAGKAAAKILALDDIHGDHSRIRISAEQGGAPFLDAQPERCLSITHSGDYAVAALGTGTTRLAVDIEKIEEGRMRNIVRVAFSDREIILLEGKKDAELYLSWTAKEAFLKYIRKGFAEGLKKVEILNGAIFHHGHPVDRIRVHSEIIDSEYAFTLIYSV